jgi:predicted metal-dependent peptidase
MSNYTPKQRIERTHVWLMSQPETAAFAGLLMVGKVSLSDEVPTAATDGLNVIYNPDFVTKLTDQELRGLVLHEALHKAYRQIWLWRHLENKQVLNMAMDYVINLEIISIHPDVALPEGGCIDKQYQGMDTYQVYQKLMQDNEAGEGTGTGSSFDEHDFEGAQDMDGQALEREIDAAIRQGQILAGKIKGNIPRSFTDITEPKIDWKQVLQDFIHTVVQGKDYATWRKPNRRYLAQGLYMPSTIAESVGELVIGIDTSGSIDDATLSRFLSELVGIVKTTPPERVHLLWWDTIVQKHDIFMPDEYDNMIAKLKPAGGGGTSVTCVTEYIKQQQLNPVAVINFTDGHLYDGFGQWSCPVLWAIVDNMSCVPPVGVTVHI